MSHEEQLPVIRLMQASSCFGQESCHAPPCACAQSLIDAVVKMERARSARLVEAMIGQRPWNEKPWARCVLAIAGRAVRRGRHLTEAEKAANLMAAMAEESQASCK